MAPPTTPAHQIGAKQAASQFPASDSAKKQKKSSAGASLRTSRKSPPHRGDADATGGVPRIPPTLDAGISIKRKHAKMKKILISNALSIEMCATPKR
jgi:hypothetical protein